MMNKRGGVMTIKELEKEIKEKITVLDKDELKEVIKFIDQLQEVEDELGLPKSDEPTPIREDE